MAKKNKNHGNMRYEVDGVTPRCTKHNEYKAKKFPTTGCPACIAKWQFMQFYVIPTTAKKKEKKKVNYVALVIDRSSSMSYLRAQTIDAVNSTLNEIKKNANDSGQETYVSIYTFASNVNTVCVDVPAAQLQKFTYSNYFCEGMTALFAATELASRNLNEYRHNNDVDASYLVITLTDGQENYSHNVNLWFGYATANSLKNFMKTSQETDLWTFAFQLPSSSDKIEFCNKFGIPIGNVSIWDVSETGLRGTTYRTNSGVASYYNARSIGKSSVQNFYTTDLSALSNKQILKMQNIANQVNIWTVDRGEVKIRDFCEEKSHKGYVKGAAFYPLTKDEDKVQDYKKLLIVEKGKKSAVYVADDARNLLGLPLYGTIKLRPGNHGNYDIYIQSTSYNRKLVRGTKLVYWTGA